MTPDSGSYRHVLAAVELDEAGAPVLKRAQALAAQFQARLSVLHVVEYLPVESGDLLVAAPVTLTQEITSQAEKKLKNLCERAGLDPASASVRYGPVAGEILDHARQHAVDLLVVGHTPRRGLLAMLFSHTDETVVARAPCDVLALRLS